MKKLTQAILSLTLVVASSMAIAEDGSDYALSNVPTAQAPQLLQDSTQPNQQSVENGLAAECC